MTAEAPATCSISLIVPTYREARNIGPLLQRVEAVRRRHGLDLELLVIDDASRDGTAEAVSQFGADWVRFVERHKPRSLSQSVLDGIRAAQNDVIVVMDADLSHPPERLVEMVQLLCSGSRFVVGSRYIEGGTTDDDLGFLRWLAGRVAMLLARPLTSVSDPMSGFFACWRRDVRVSQMDPVGYKIGLELLVRMRVAPIAEVPIHFADGRLGSKFGFKQQLLYLQHLRRLYLFRFGMLSELIHFALVGSSGVVVNLAVLTLLLAVGVDARASLAIAIAVSMVTNFFLNRRLTFGYARSGNIGKQFVGFVAACSLGAVINYGFSLLLLRIWPQLAVQLAALGGVLAGLGFNFLANRFLVFKKRHVLPPAVLPPAVLPHASSEPGSASGAPEPGSASEAPVRTSVEAAQSDAGPSEVGQLRGGGGAR